jgi:hypothetical protein
VTTCASCRTVGPAGAAWCPECYLPYARPGTTTTTVPAAARHRPQAPPAQSRTSWGVRLICAGLVAVVGGVLWIGIPRGLACRTSQIHPNVKQVSAAVQKDLTVVRKLATGPNQKGWTLADGASVIAADAALAKTLTPVQLSPEDRGVVTTYLNHVRSFDAALSAYMAKDDDATHESYRTAAVALQDAADQLGSGLSAIPPRCHLS